MIVNGNEMKFRDSINVTELLRQLNLNEEKVVVEINLNIVPKHEYSQTMLNDEDKIEIVSFVGGG